MVVNSEILYFDDISVQLFLHTIIQTVHCKDHTHKPTAMPGMPSNNLKFGRTFSNPCSHQPECQNPLLCDEYHDNFA
jgi:hypothetical protein